jgi:biopolymer transport protein ExbD
MTSLIDVIFLLLLFFMLTSTFSKFAELELSAAGSTASAGDVAPLFLQLGADTLRLNGVELALESLNASLQEQSEAGATLLVSLGAHVDAQRLTDVLVALRGIPALNVSVLGG